MPIADNGPVWTRRKRLQLGPIIHKGIQDAIGDWQETDFSKPRVAGLGCSPTGQKDGPLRPAGPDSLEPGSGGGHHPLRRWPGGHMPPHELCHGLGQLGWSGRAIRGGWPWGAAEADGSEVQGVGVMEAEAEADQRRCSGRTDAVFADEEDRPVDMRGEWGGGSGWRGGED